MHIRFTAPINEEIDAYEAACRRIVRWNDPEINATVHVRPRDKDGSLEWHIELRRPDGTLNGALVIFIGMIQRAPNEPYSFHS
jgi:hypothetical protein